LEHHDIQIINLDDSLDKHSPFGTIFHLVDNMTQPFFNCMISCLKFAYNTYFNDSTRFDFDSPYQSFDDILANSKLLSQTSLYLFQAAQADLLNEEAEQSCNENEYCKLYDTLQLDLVKTMLETNGDYDALLMPTETSLPFFPREQNYFVSFENMPTYAPYLSIFSRFPVLNIPVGFSNDGNELPIGAMLVSKPARFDRTLQIAKLLEQTANNNKLPLSTPLLRNL
jgi:Asp-tRNA(Asn)/Glu-tRNA(Gln) amidotransferase A subunit family amidase